MTKTSHRPGRSESLTLPRRSVLGPLPSLLPLLVVVLHHADIASSASCTVRRYHDCSYGSDEYQATTKLTLRAEVADSSVYDADITYRWDGAEDAIVYGTYDANAGVDVARSHTWNVGGYHVAGYTVSFDDGIGCDTSVYNYDFRVYFPTDGGDCEFYELSDGTTNAPTDMDTSIQPSPPPSDRPTIAVPLTTTPQISPSTPPPTTIEPTSTSIVETPIPTEEPTTPSPVPAGGPASPTSEPTIEIPTASPTTRPIPDQGQSSPPPSPITMAMREYNVSSTMFLYYSDELDGDSETSWIEVTEGVIRGETASYVGVVPGTVDVDVMIKGQSFMASSRSRILGEDGPMYSTPYYGASRRNLQSSLPLAIEFDSIVRFPSVRGDWDAGEMVGGGFRTMREQSKYILDLQSANTTHFGNLGTMALAVEGELVTVTEPVTTEPNNDNSLYYIIAGAVGAFLVLILTLAIVYYRGHQRRDESDDRALNVQVVEADKDGGVEKSQTDTDTYQDTINRQSYFGTIEQNDIEDISTLGDPYMGEVVNPAMNTDITVGESLISKQEQLFIYGVGKPKVGTGMESRMGDTTVTGSKAMLFGDDITLEDIYQTSGGVGAPPSLDFITVVAPAGMMGIVLDNPTGDFPVVHAIKESSPLHGSIFVGDLLVSVDEIDCRGMSPRAISSFLSSRSQNPGRTLVLARDSS